MPVLVHPLVLKESLKEFSDTYAPVGDGVLDVPPSAPDAPQCKVPECRRKTVEWSQ
jgi:hypothetical protein